MSIKKNKIGNSKKTLHVKLAPACFATMLALGMVIPVQAAVIADGSAQNQPGIHTGANGSTVVDINAASAGGVSHNVYTEFNVDSKGVVLNNSGASSNTQLAGQIAGNSNMANGSATIILNEVRSSDPSQLNGMVEVAGQSAQVIIANPAGISCDGCGFINSNHATLTTGVSTTDSQGKLTGVDVKKGQIIITGKGMDTSSSKYTDIIARSVKVNSQLKADELNIITGSNHIDKNGNARAISGTGSAPEMALDVSSLGSMYANKIYMKGTDAGVGVRVNHADLTANDSLTMDVNGTINIDGGHLSAGKDLNLQTSHDIINHDSVINAGGTTIISAQHNVDNSHGTISGNNVSVFAQDNINNTHGVINGSQGAGVISNNINNANGNITSEGTLSLDDAGYKSNAAGLTNTHGNISAKGDIDINSANVNNAQGVISSGHAMNINTGSLSNGQGLIAAGNANSYSSSTISARSLDNSNGHITVTGKNSDLTVVASSNMNNRDGAIASEGNVNLNDIVDNTAGTISAGNDLFMYGNSYTSDAKSVLNAGHDASINASQKFQNAGTISTGNDLSIVSNSHSSSMENSGKIDAKGRMTVQKSSGQFTNYGTINAAQLDMQLSGDLYNNGSMTSQGDINISANQLFNNENATLSAGKNLTGYISNLTTQRGSSVNAGQDIDLSLRGDMNNAGNMTAGNNIALAATSTSHKTGIANNSGKISAGGSVDVTASNSNLTNDGTISGDRGLTLTTHNTGNYGELTSAGNINVVSYSGITNQGKITGKGDVNLDAGNSTIYNANGATISGNTVSTHGKLSNAGTITQTGTNVTPDNGGKTPDTNNGTPDNNSHTPVTPDNNSHTPVTPDNNSNAEHSAAKPSVEVNGRTYSVGDKYANGRVITDITVYPNGNFSISFA